MTLIFHWLVTIIHWWELWEVLASCFSTGTSRWMGNDIAPCSWVMLTVKLQVILMTKVARYACCLPVSSDCWHALFAYDWNATSGILLLGEWVLVCCLLILSCILLLYPWSHCYLCHQFMDSCRFDFSMSFFPFLDLQLLLKHPFFPHL